MARTFKTPKNYQGTMKKLEYNFPGLPLNLPRAPNTYHNLDTVDIYVAKRKLELLNRIPRIDRQVVRERVSDFGLDKGFVSALMQGGYISVENEIKALFQEEQSLLENSAESGRAQSFLVDKFLTGELIKGLIACAETVNADASERVRVRRAVGERMITLGDFWLARKMFTKCFEYLEYIDEESDKMRVELWCLLSYVCIYFEESQEFGYDLPGTCLNLAQNLSKGKRWSMKKSVMNILIPKAINVYGLKNDWLKIKSDWVDVYDVATTLLHILAVKKARFWQEELNLGNCRSINCAQLDPEKLEIYENITDALTSALAYADEARQNPAFIATTLRRGLFYEEFGENEKAMEDFVALFTLCTSFNDNETLAVVLNRLGKNEIQNKKAVEGLDYFVQEFEAAKESEFPELVADALKDLGSVLLQEGHTWEADECFNNCYTLFKENKENDTPNDMDDLNWAMVGISSGHHLWSRYTGLIRTQDTRNLRSVNEWKCSRKPLLLVNIPDGARHPKRRSEADRQYVQGPKDETNKNSKRRLFEFGKELGARNSAWFEAHGYDDVFDYVETIQKPTEELPSFDDELLHQWEDEDARLANARQDKIRRATSMANSLRKTIIRLSVTSADHSGFQVRKDLKTFGSSERLEGHTATTITQTMETFLDEAQAAMEKHRNVRISNEVDEDDASEDPELKATHSQPHTSSKKSILRTRSHSHSSKKHS